MSVLVKSRRSLREKKKIKNKQTKKYHFFTTQMFEALAKQSKILKNETVKLTDTNYNEDSIKAQ